MKLSDVMTLSDWVKVLDTASEFAVSPYLIAAIGWHETHWGRLGAGRKGWILGYGYFPGSTVAEKYKGLENQLRGACRQIARDLKKPLSLSTLTDFAKNSWKPGNPEAWAESVWKIYTALQDDLSPLLYPGGTLPKQEPVKTEVYVSETSAKGLLAKIASKIEELVKILREWEV